MTSNRATEMLRKAGFRATKPRVAIYEALARTHTPLSVEQLSRKLDNVNIDRVTVYRTLEAFERAALARSVDFKQGHALYELSDEHDHHHIVCTRCGTVEDFEGCSVEPLAAQALKASKTFRTVSDHSFELFGTCNSCAQ